MGEYNLNYNTFIVLLVGFVFLTIMNPLKQKYNNY